MDLELGREGGTWMAMNNRGQISALLNVLRPFSKVAHGKRNRGTVLHVYAIEFILSNPLSGFLVPQFLQSNSDGPHFLNALSLQSRDYADFLMVTLDFE